MNFILKHYLNPHPSKLLKLLRFVVHWITLPIKLFIIGPVMIFAIIYHNMTTKGRKPLNETASITLKNNYFYNIFKQLPLLQHKGMLIYVSRVPLDEKPNGRNHNDDHQAARHGTWTFLMKKLGFNTSEMDKAMAAHCQPRVGIVRGFKGDKETGEIRYNAKSVSGDQLLGIALATMNNPSDELRDAYEMAITSVINNDYSILEGYDNEPMDKLAQNEWRRQLKEKKSKYEIYMKSSRAIFTPGLTTVGAQAITILAAIRVAALKINSKFFYKEYNKLLWMYGYGLLSLFPTTFIPGAKNRNYFNDHNMMIGLYILASFATNSLGKWYWKTIMKMVYLLSNKWKNGYFAGLMHEIDPKFVTKKHLEEIEKYLYEEEPRFENIEYVVAPKKTKPDSYPVRYNAMNRGGEFHPDLEPLIHSGGSGIRVKNGLGWFAHAVMVNPENAKKIIKGIS